MIFVEDNQIKINGVVLPGLVKSIEVKESAQIDEQTVEGSTAKPKQATGYEDVKINIELIIDDTPTQTKYQRLEVVRALFRKPGQTVPQPIPIVCEATNAHGVEKVLFKGIAHKTENKKGQLPVTLEFWEYIPATITATKSGSKSSSSSSTSTTDNSLNSDYTNYLNNSRGKTPAVDDADATAALSTVSNMPYN